MSAPVVTSNEGMRRDSQRGRSQVDPGRWHQGCTPDSHPNRVSASLSLSTFT